MASRDTAKRSSTGPAINLMLAGVVALAFSAIMVQRRTKETEAENPPTGKFVTVRGVRLHYVELGDAAAPPLVIIPGNGSMASDWLISGVADRAAAGFRVVIVERPGFGHSTRPGGNSWWAPAQASLLPDFFDALGISRPIVIGHSWGAMVAAALALAAPHSVAGLMLASGYYYPTARPDALVFNALSYPVVGDIVRNTIAPFAGEYIGPLLIEQMFAPRPVPPQFSERLPLAMTLRPSQIDAFAEDNGTMTQSARAMQSHYGEITCPVTIVTGDSDCILDYREQSRRLNVDIPFSTFEVFEGVGHMPHHADPERFMSVINDLAEKCRYWKGPSL